MKRKKSEILSQIGRDPGFKVPDNYFADFADKMASSLPEREFVTVKPKTTWEKVRPYVYMAAMFGGIWCMMYMFNMMRENTTPFTPSFAEAFRSETFVDDFVLTKSFDEYDLLQQMYEDSIDITYNDDTVTVNFIQ